MSLEDRKGVSFPVTGTTGSVEPPDVGVQNWI